MQFLLSYLIAFTLFTASLILSEPSIPMVDWLAVPIVDWLVVAIVSLIIALPIWGTIRLVRKFRVEGAGSGSAYIFRFLGSYLPFFLGGAIIHYLDLLSPANVDKYEKYLTNIASNNWSDVIYSASIASVGWSLLAFFLWQLIRRFLKITKDPEERKEWEKEDAKEARKAKLRSVKQNYSGDLEELFGRRGFKQNLRDAMDGKDKGRFCYWCGAERNYLEHIGGDIVDVTYQFMNADGSRDKRRKNNPKTVKYDAEYKCTNCEAEIHLRHKGTDEPYEYNVVVGGYCAEVGKCDFNETEFLRDRNTKKVAALPLNKKSEAQEYCRSSNLYHRKPFFK